MNEKQKKLIELLKEMFQLNQTDLDFGIYRIMNQKADEINQFLEKDLISSIKNAFSSNSNDSLKKELDDLILSITNAGMNPEDSPKVKEIREKLASSSSSEQNENEIYSYMTNFFSRYYKDGDFVSLRRYKKDTYAIPYEGEEVKLHWANSDQYYIKTSEFFKDYTFKVGNNTYHFKIVDANTEQNNNKANSENERRFVLDFNYPLYEENGELFIRFEYKAIGKEPQSKLNEKAIETILKEQNPLVKNLQTLAPTEKNKTRTILEKHLTDYTSKNSFDYFIHKDLKGFLTRELDFYIKNEILYIDDILNVSSSQIENTLNKVKTFKTIAQKIIAFLSQLEEFQKKLWLKKKFVIDTNYCITLDKIDEKFYTKIVENSKQLQEWKELFDVEINSVDDLKKERFLVLDTKFFDSSFKDELLGEFDDIDKECDGVLINSENFGALNLLQERYKEQVKTVYIDPPYNTGDDGFLYKDNYRDSSWLTMIENRMNILKTFLNKLGAIFISIDDRELFNLQLLMNEIYSEYASKNIAIKMAEPTGKKMASVIKSGSIPKLKEYGLVYKHDKVNGFDFERIPKEKWDNEYKTVLTNVSKSEIVFIKSIRDDEDYTSENLIKVDEILSKIEFISLANFAKNENLSINDEWKYQNAWRIIRDASLEGGAKLIADEKNSNRNNGAFYILTPQNKMYFIKAGYNINVSSPRVKLLFADDYLTLHGGDFWSDIKTTGLDNEGYVEFLNGKKPLKLIKRFISSISCDKDIIIDFFAGSGTTVQAIIQLNIENKTNLKFLVCDMGNYFNEKLKIRTLKTQYYEKYSSLLKYFKLESYEDTLNNLAFKNVKEDLFEASVKEDYLLNYILDYETNDSLLNLDSFKTPFDYKLKIASASAGESIETNIDLVETFNYLIGLKVKTRAKKRGFLVIEGENLKEEKILIIWRDNKSNQELNEFFSKMDFTVYDKEFDTIFVNGDNNLANLKTDENHFKVKLIEEEFKARMFGE